MSKAVQTETLKAQCHCVAVKFEAPAPVTSVDACHCKTCQAINAGPYMGAAFHGGITITQGEMLSWYDSSDWARRGFCRQCGSALFYNLKGTDFYSVSSGCLDIPGSISLGNEYFIDQKPELYTFMGERPRLSAAEVFSSFQKQSSNDD